MNTNNNIELVKDFISSHKKFKEEIGKVIIGQNEAIEKIFICMLSQGHALLMGVPGLAKTLLVNSIAPNRLLLSVSAIAGILSVTALSINSSILIEPSSIE